MPALKKIKVLITGFGPFPGMHLNPSEKLLRWIEKRHIPRSHDIQLKTIVIPTTWSAVEQFSSQTLAKLDPDIALHFGVHSRAAGLCIETLARNCTCTQADAMGRVSPRHCVKDHAPQTLKSTIGTAKLITELRARGLPVHNSTNAGRYLCNALLFASLYQSRKRTSPRQTGFIHVPPLNVRGMNKNALLKAAVITISHCVSCHTRKTLMREVTGG